MKVHLTLKSANAKVGPIPVSTTEQSSCPDSCPLKAAGCYAKGGPLALHWRKVPERGMDWNDFCQSIALLKEGQVWRHNQAGDLPHVNQTIDAAAVDLLVASNAGKMGYTYTHHDVLTNQSNRDTVARCNENGFTVNLSADTLAEADSLAALNIGPVCVILPYTDTKNTVTPEGRRVVICPSATKDNVTCESCKLCARSNRTTIVGFPAHGMQKKKATAVSLSS